MSKLIFLSHIHEERALALLIKEALEDEFGGFVDVFVSSDGTSIPAGANFLKRIEDGLVDCVAALYLISPQSVKRNWINFELGAVWIRNALSIRSGGPEVPALPVCHSGSTPGTLPAPLNNLNGIIATQSSALEFAFRSLQVAVGGRGRLRTDFDDLAQKIVEFQTTYTLGANLVKVVKVLGFARQDVEAIIARSEALLTQVHVPRSALWQVIDCGWRETHVIDQLKALGANELSGKLDVQAGTPMMRLGENMAGTGSTLEIRISAEAVAICKKELLNQA